MSGFEVIKGDSPVILAQPHGGTDLPDGIFARLNRRGQGLADTDWHISRLYDGLLASATVVHATTHRYVIDLNRDPLGASLYPGQNTTTLCPTTDFEGQDIWRTGQEPSTDEISARREKYHAPYHAALASQIARVQARHGVALLFDCHSIRGEIPFLFAGRLPDFNIGTNSGRSCAESIANITRDTCARPAFSSVTNGRFKGGWTTRHYGRPASGVHAIQLELAQRRYMAETPPWAYNTERAQTLRAVLADILTALDSHARSGALTP